MAGTVNPAYENTELDALEVGHRSDSPTNKETGNKKLGCLEAGSNKLSRFISRNPRATKYSFLVILNCLVLIYFVFATLYWIHNHYDNEYDWCHGYGLLILLIAITYGGILYKFLVSRFLPTLINPCTRSLKNCTRGLRNIKHCDIIIKSTIYCCIFAAIVIFLIIDTLNSTDRLISAIGVITLLSLGWIFSKHPGRVNWRPVLNGLILQFLFGLVIIRWEVGRNISQCIADKVETFLGFAKNGASFVFSDKLVMDGVFAFSALPVIFYFSFFIQILYYLGVMQCVIFNLGRILQSMMGTSICESVICAANIFIGMSESPLIVKPYLNKLTTSELHTIMSSGFATVSGTVLAAYIEFGANPAYLLTASVMAAPAALCYSKLFYPETEKSVITSDKIKLEKSKDSSLMAAASNGALAAIPLVLGIIANIVAFVSFIAFANGLLSWLGSLVGYREFTIEFILSKVFMPLSWIMGVPWEHCEDVGTLIGLKTIANEFVAYQKLGEFKRQGRLFGRSETIATFAICGFANPGSMGISLGVLSQLAPDKKQNIADSIARAFVAGSAVNFLTASIAGMLSHDEFFPHIRNLAVANTTVS